MPTPPVLHEFRLYRSGWAEGTPWPDNQLWANGVRSLMPDASNALTLDPMYGSAASWYQVHLSPAESAEIGWTSWRARLIVDTMQIGYPSDYPLTWYDGNPSDWPSGLVRFPESRGPSLPNFRSTFPDDGPRGVWTLAVRRTS